MQNKDTENSGKKAVFSKQHYVSFISNTFISNTGSRFASVSGIR